MNQEPWWSRMEKIDLDYNWYSKNISLIIYVYNSQVQGEKRNKKQKIDP